MTKFFIFIAAAFFFVVGILPVRAETYSYKCSCSYVWSDDEDVEIKNGQMKWQIGETKDIEIGENKMSSVKFGAKGDCAGTIQDNFNQLKTNGVLEEAACTPEKCQVLVPPTKDTPGILGKCTPQTPWKWTSYVGYPDKPVEIVWGETSEKQIEAAGPDSIKYVCKDCLEDGTAAFVNPTTGDVTWDTKKTDETKMRSWILAGGIVTLGVRAVNADDETDFLDGTIYYKLKPPECEKLAANKTECDEANPRCMVVDGVCKYRYGLSVEQFSKASAGVTKEWLIEQYPSPRKEGWEGALPECAFSGTCRSINDLTQLLVNFGKGMFAIMGSFAFAFFVYGGFTMIVSMGNAEKQKKGQQILVAAVIGLVIAFSAYMLINFMLGALGVAPDFRGIK